MSALWLAWRTRLFAAGAAVLAVLAGLGAAYRAGWRARQARQDRASLDNLRIRERVDDKMHSLPLDDVRSDLNRWVRDDERR